MTKQKSFHVCESERQFLDLTGEGSELVKMTLNLDNQNYYLNGFYLFLRENNKNSFIRQSPTDVIILDRVLCPTKYLQFDRKSGIIPDNFHYSYRSVGPQIEGYSLMVEKLKEIDGWKECQIKISSISNRFRISEQKRRFFRKLDD